MTGSVRSQGAARSYFALMQWCCGTLSAENSIVMNHLLADVAPHSWQQVVFLGRERSSRQCRGSEGAELLAQRLQQLRLDREYMKVSHSSAYEDLERVYASCRFQRICAQD